MKLKLEHIGRWFMVKIPGKKKSPPMMLQSVEDKRYVFAYPKNGNIWVFFLEGKDIMYEVRRKVIPPIPEYSKWVRVKGEAAK